MKNVAKIMDRIFEILTPVLFLCYGIAVFIFSGLDFSQDSMLVVLEICLIVSGVAKIVDFIGGHKINRNFNFVRNSRNISWCLCTKTIDKTHNVIIRFKF